MFFMIRKFIKTGCIYPVRMPKKITKEMGIVEIVEKYPKTVKVFDKYGLHCIGCVAARFEHLEEGCKAHGIDVDQMVDELNKKIEK